MKEEVLASVKPTSYLLSTMIRRLKLKDQHFKTHEAASEEDMTTLWENVLKIDESPRDRGKTAPSSTTRRGISSDLFLKHIAEYMFFKKCITYLILFLMGPETNHLKNYMERTQQKNICHLAVQLLRKATNAPSIQQPKLRKMWGW
ncbi:hypothetical protein SKAU_G00061330 [Synaphobranchus kaupii]|uniref:Uncharacterized protein n=1 Tax=Synaphobranchus kaupii TaxID=118154 RepID=A0A9Q1G5T9_SYNKA|nr:hypothetical protein SKAU_G00061330 [Synaphobranchus kaupii]